MIALNLCTIPTATICNDRDAVPHTRGVYLVSSNDLLLNQDLDIAPTQESTPLYVGRARNLSQRLRYHLRGPTAASTLRVSLGLLLTTRLGLKVEVADIGGRIWFQNESVLSEWMAENVSVSYCEMREPEALEIDLIQRLQPPLNIAYRHKQPSAVRLASARTALRHAHRRALSGNSGSFGLI